MRVIPPAMVAGNLNADEAMARRFFQAYAEALHGLVAEARTIMQAPPQEAMPTLNGAETLVAQSSPNGAATAEKKPRRTRKPKTVVEQKGNEDGRQEEE